MVFERNEAHTLRQRLDESPTFIIVVAGPRQIGKSTLVRQVLAGRPAHFVAADQPLPEIADPFSSLYAESPFASISLPGARPTAEWLAVQ